MKHRLKQKSTNQKWRCPGMAVKKAYFCGMFTAETQIRVRYGETDQMGMVYYGNYPLYFEVARVEAFRVLGSTYRRLEESGVGMPVAQMNISYKRPARYDDLLTIKTRIPVLPTSKITFEHEVYNEEGQLLTTATLVLVFISMKTMKPVRCPETFYDNIKPYFA